MQLTDRCAIVTGAGSGLGRATAIALHAAGAKVMLLDVSQDSVERVAAALGERALARKVDVRDSGEIGSAIAQARAQLGDVRIVVNCAGIASAMKIVSNGAAHDLELWQRVLDVNLSGTFNLMRLAAAEMVRNTPDETGERGVIVNTASVAGYEGQRGQAAYAASKAGVIGLTLPVARDLAPHAIRCVAIAPGLFETGMVQEVGDKALASLQRGLLYPSRMGRPDEFAALVRHIAENAYLNGVCLRLDAGIRLAAA